MRIICWLSPVMCGQLNLTLVPIEVGSLLLQYTYCPTGALGLPGTVLEFVLLKCSYCPACVFGVQDTATNLECMLMR